MRKSDGVQSTPLLGGSGGMLPRKFLKNSCPEIESGVFGVLLADYPTVVSKNYIVYPSKDFK